MEKERKSNFELLRIIAMFWIVLYHCCMYSGFTTNNSNINIIEIIMQIIGMFGIAGNVIFTMISGYFLINNKDIKTSKVIKILLQVWTYSFAILFIFLKTNIISVNNIDIIKNLVPLSFGNNWYITFYFMLCLLFPYINSGLRNISKSQYKMLLLIMFICYCLFGSIKSDFLLNSRFVYYIFVYCVGAYIKLYEKDITITRKKSLLFFVISVMITIFAIILVHLIKLKYSNLYELGIRKIFRSHHSIFQFLIGLFMFLIFKNLNIKNNKIINMISGCTLGIYLLHENYFVKRYIWKNIFKLNLIQNEPKVIFYTLLCCILIFVICTIIELIRKNTIEKLYMKYIEKNEEKLNKIKIKIGERINNFIIFIGLEKSKE